MLFPRALGGSFTALLYPLEKCLHFKKRLVFVKY